jgi:signal transduction histidine kinase
VTVPFWRSQLVPDSAAGYRLLLAAPTLDSVSSAPTNPTRTPFLLHIRADPNRVAEVLYGSSLPAAVPVAALLVVSLTLLVATVMLAHRFERHARDRDAFASSVAHELRTPLTQILLHAETLQLDRPAAQTRQDASRVIVRETRRLIHLVENALQFVRGGRSAMRLDPRLVSVADVVGETLDGLAPVLEAAVARVERKLDADAIALVDANALRQVVVNLVDNALRFGPPGQTIVVRVWARDGFVSLAVEDEGPGIAVADRERVFGSFVTASASSGSGIGLAVVRQLVDLHDGRVTIEDAPTGGARIVVRLQAADAAAGASATVTHQA